MAATIGVPLYACGGGTIPLLQAWLMDGMSVGSAAVKISVESITIYGGGNHETLETNFSCGTVTFAPDSSMTRAMMVTVLHRAAGTPASTGENAFTDNVPGSWSYDAVLWASADHVLAGYGDGRFGSGDPVTRVTGVQTCALPILR